MMRLILIALIALAAPPAAPPSFYEKIVEASSQISREDKALIGHYLGGVYVPPAKIKAALERHRPLLDLIRQAGDVPPATFSRADGPGVLLPHLGVLRHAARAFSAESSLFVQSGNAAGAMHSARLSMGMANLTARDGYVISSLVGQAMFSLVDRDMQGLLESGEVTPEVAKQCLDLFEKMPAADPFGMADGMRDEATWMSEWLRHEAEGSSPEEMRKKIAEIIPLSQGDVISENPQRDIDLYETTVDRMATAMANPDAAAAEAEIASIQADIDQGKCGSLAFLMPGVQHLLRQKIRGEEMLAKRRQLLTDIAEGRIDPATFTTAHAIYQRIFAAIERLPSDAREAVFAFARGMEVPDALFVETILDTERERILKPLAVATRIDRCAFPPESHVTVWLPQAPGLLECGLFLLADARRQISSGDLEAASASLGTTYRLIRHVADDASLLCGLVASHLATQTRMVIQPVLDANALTEDQLNTIALGIGRIDRIDPFGFRRAEGPARAEVHGWLDSVPESPLKSAMRRRLAPQDATSLLEFVAMRDGSSGLNHEADAPGEMDRLIDRLNGLLDAEGLKAFASMNRDFPLQLARCLNEQAAPPQDLPTRQIVDLQPVVMRATDVLRTAMRGFERPLESILLGAHPPESQPSSTNEPQPAEVGDDRPS